MEYSKYKNGAGTRWVETKFLIGWKWFIRYYRQFLLNQNCVSTILYAHNGGQNVKIKILIVHWFLGGGTLGRVNIILNPTIFISVIDIGGKEAQSVISNLDLYTISGHNKQILSNFGLLLPPTVCNCRVKPILKLKLIC